MSSWNGNRFSVYTSEEKSVLGLIKEMGDQTNYNSDEIVRLTESDNKKVSHKEMQEVYKIDKQANFTGSWFGIKRPTQSSEGLAATVDQLIDETIPGINSQLEHIENKQNNIKEINVLDYGVILNDETKALDNTNIINNLAINNQWSILKFPIGDYYFKNGLIFDNINVQGQGVNTNFIFVDDGIKAITFGGNRCKIENLRITKKVRNHNINTVGLEISRKDGDGNNTYNDRISCRDIFIYNFTTSFAIEGVYFIDLYNINTFKDKFGFTVNKELKENSITSLPCTTINATHLYCNGSGGEYEPSVDSVGWWCNDFSDINLNNCVSELYHQGFYFNNGNTVNILAPYWEHCKIGGTLASISGTTYILNPYFNNFASLTGNHLITYTGWKNVTIVGGRILGLLDNQYIVKKETEGSVTLMYPPTTRGVTSSNGWEYQGVMIINDTNITKKSKTDTEKSYSCRYYNKGIDIYPLGINQNDSTQPIEFKINGVKYMSLLPSGNLQFEALRGVILKSNNGTNYKIYVEDNGTLGAVRM